jgi:AraC-like DNA-binding protein
MIETSPATVASIRFDRRKYGARLLADACAVGSLPFFIKTPRPHRLAFYEVALITEGRGALALDGVAVEVAPYRVCVTAPGEVRSWRLAGARLEGLLAFFEADLFDEAVDPAFIERLSIASAAPAARSIAVDHRCFDRLAGLAAAMGEELRAPDADTPAMLRAQARQLMIAVQRASGLASIAPGENRAAVLSRRFARLVDERFLHGESVARYAERLGVTVRHLNHCVRERTGRTAAETIRGRVFLEARRRLLAGSAPVAAIGDALGFSDTPYFIRFFRRHAGVTPGEFRAARGSPVFDRLRPLPGRDG